MTLADRRHDTLVKRFLCICVAQLISTETADAAITHVARNLNVHDLMTMRTLQHPSGPAATLQIVEQLALMMLSTARKEYPLRAAQAGSVLMLLMELGDGTNAHLTFAVRFLLRSQSASDSLEIVNLQLGRAEDQLFAKYFKPSILSL
jgi:hypothetical protein